MDKKLIIFDHNKANRNVCIQFIEVDEDGKLMSEEIAIFEEKELYKIMKNWLVKYDIKRGQRKDERQ